MNKWQIICPLAAMAVFATIAIPRYVRRAQMQRRDAITWRAYCGAHDLERTTNSMNPAIHKTLKQFLATPENYDEVVYHGDEPPPVGDGRATHRLLLRNSNGAWLGLRLQDEPTRGKFHILGSFTPANPPESYYQKDDLSDRQALSAFSRG